MQRYIYILPVSCVSFINKCYGAALPPYLHVLLIHHVEGFFVNVVQRIVVASVLTCNNT